VRMVQGVKFKVQKVRANTHSALGLLN